MKIPPLKEMEPLPPVPELPACSHIDATVDAADEICELSSDSDVDDADVMQEGASLASGEAGSFLDMDLPKVFNQNCICFMIRDDMHNFCFIKSAAQFMELIEFRFGIAAVSGRLLLLLNGA